MIVENIETKLTTATISSEAQQIANNLLDLFLDMNPEEALFLALEIEKLEPNDEFKVYRNNPLS